MRGLLCVANAFVGVFLLPAAVSAGVLAPANAGGHPLTYWAPGTSGPIELTLRREGSRVIVLDGGIPAASTEADAMSSIQIGGPDGVDTSLTIDYSPGSIAVPIDYHPGAGGYNVLTLQGSVVGLESHLLTGPHSGVITLDGRTVAYSNLTPITDTISSPTVTIVGTPGFDTINIVDGPVVGVQTTQVNSGAGATFESYNFANKASVTIDGNGGGDAVTINNPNPAAGWTTLNLTGVGSVGETGPLTVPNLAITSTGAVNLTTATNQVSVVAGKATDAGAPFLFNGDAATLLVAQVGSVIGVTTNGGAVQVANTQVGGSLSVKNAIMTSNGNVVLYADNVSFSAVANAGAGTVYIDTIVLARPITLGTTPGTSLGLLQADLNEITAGVLRIGDENTDSGGLMLTAPITAPAGAPGTWSTIDLRNASAIQDSNLGTDLFVPNVALRSHTDIGASGTFGFVDVQAATVAASCTGAGGVQVSSLDSLVIGSVAGLSGITSASTVFVQVGGGPGSLAINAPVNAGASPVNLEFVGPVSGGSGTVTGSAVSFHYLAFTGYNYTLTGTSFLQSPSVTPIPLSTPSLTVTGGLGEDVFVVTPSATTTFTVNGSDPLPPSTGDAVVIAFGGTTSPCLSLASDPMGYSGTYTFGNRQPVSFTQIETLPTNPDVTPPGVSAPSPSSVTQTICS